MANVALIEKLKLLNVGKGYVALTYDISNFNSFLHILSDSNFSNTSSLENNNIEMEKLF